MGPFGAEWSVAPDWLVTGGVAYDSSPVNDDNRALALPMGATWRLGIGGEWAASKAIELGLAYQLGWLGNLAVDQSRQVLDMIVNRVSGEYENTALHTFAANLRWNF